MSVENNDAESMGKLVESQSRLIKGLIIAMFVVLSVVMAAVIFLKADTPLTTVECLDPTEIAEITYSPEHENMVQLVWPEGSSNMLPWGSVLEADFDDGAGRYFTNVCNLQPVFNRLMCRLYGIGGIGGFDLQNREFWTIRVVDQTPFPHLEKQQ